MHAFRTVEFQMSNYSIRKNFMIWVLCISDVFVETRRSFKKLVQDYLANIYLFSLKNV